MLYSPYYNCSTSLNEKTHEYDSCIYIPNYVNYKQDSYSYGCQKNRVFYRSDVK